MELMIDSGIGFRILDLGFGDRFNYFYAAISFKNINYFLNKAKAEILIP